MSTYNSNIIQIDNLDLIIIKDFISGSHEQQREYKSFLPTLINREWQLSNPKTMALLDEATRLLGELNAFAKLVPDVDFFISMHITKEATTSSRIEGTRTNMEEALISIEDVDPEKRDDWQEVQNYITAMRQAIAILPTIPLSTRLLKHAHHNIMQGVRGEHKSPGEFRASQNWIGATLKRAVFVPPHHLRVPVLMSDFEKFIHNQEIYVPHLIKVAILHYQFETIHPFLDGNGRLGRLLIILYLTEFKLLSKPALYLSDFFERNKTDYYDHLTQVRTHNRLEEWIQFFLIGVKETAERSIQTFNDIIALKEKLAEQVLPRFHTRKLNNATKLLRELYRQPVVSIKDVTQLLEVSPSTASAIIKDFKNYGVLEDVTEAKRNQLFVFREYFLLFQQ